MEPHTLVFIREAPAQLEAKRAGVVSPPPPCTEEGREIDSAGEDECRFRFPCLFFRSPDRGIPRPCEVGFRLPSVRVSISYEVLFAGLLTCKLSSYPLPQTFCYGLQQTRFTHVTFISYSNFLHKNDYEHELFAYELFPLRTLYIRAISVTNLLNDELQQLRTLSLTNLVQYDHLHMHLCLRTLSHTNHFRYELQHTNLLHTNYFPYEL